MVIDLVKSKSADIMKNASNDYQALKNKDKTAKAETLKPGENMGFPTYDNFYISDNRNKCDDILSGYRTQMNGLLDEVRTEIKKKSVEPPTNEQINLLSVLAIGKPTKEELQNALDLNNGNYSTYSAIHRIANENGIHLDDTKSPVADLQNLQMELANNVSSLYTNSAETRLSAGYQSFAELMGGVFQ